MVQPSSDIHFRCLYLKCGRTATANAHIMCTPLTRARSQVQNFEGVMELFGGAKIVTGLQPATAKLRRRERSRGGVLPHKILKNRRSLLASECIPGPQSEVQY